MSDIISIPIYNDLRIIMKDIEGVNDNFFLGWLGEVIELSFDSAFIDEPSVYQDELMRLIKLGWNMSSRNITMEVFSTLVYKTVNQYAEISVNYNIGPGRIVVIAMDAEAIKLTVKERLDEYPVE